MAVTVTAGHVAVALVNGSTADVVTGGSQAAAGHMEAPARKHHAFMDLNWKQQTETGQKVTRDTECSHENE